MLPVLFQKSKKFRILFFALTLSIINLGGWQAARAKVQIDGTFAPVLGERDFGPASVLVLPDGKLITVRQSNENLLDDPQYKVTRLNADGSVDRVFDSVVLYRGDAKLLLQPDGRILVCHSNIIADGQNRGGLVRLNADGTLDTSFNPQGILIADGGVLQPDGKIIVGTVVYSSNAGSNIAVTYRFLPDGTKDQTFTPYTSSEVPWTIALQPNGKIILGYRVYSSSPAKRLNADGTPDTTFNTQFGASAIAIQANGGIIVGNSSGVMRLNDDGSLDSAFPAQAAYSGYRVHGMLQQPDGKILIGGDGWYYLSLTTLKKRLTRINPDGTQDTTFDTMTGDSFGYDSIIPLALRPDGRILATGTLIQSNVRRDGLFSLNPNGTIDQTFTADLGYVAGRVTLVKRQPDGKILIVGFFARVNNFPTFALARLNPDGTTDTGFSFSEQITNTTQGVNFVAVEVAFQTDGRILIGGNFRFNGQENYGVFRLNQNGSLDSSFTPHRFTFPPSYIYTGVNALALQADGKILVGGGFQNYGNSGRDKLVRLNTDGSVDASYAATSTGISKMLIQPGGKIVVSGTITVNGVTKTNPRLNTDGTIDPTFNMPTDVGSLYAVAPDGRLATSGWFQYSKYSVNHVFRLNPDGSRDTSFSTPRSFDGVSDITFQNDGQILVSRNYYIVRYDGTENVREIFRQVNGGGTNIRTMLVTPDNKLVVGGMFGNLAGAKRTGIARFLLNSGDFDFDGDSLADFCVFRPSERNWYILRSSDGASAAANFGLQNDTIAPADFDGDGRTDIAVFRPSDGGWYRLNSSNNTFSAAQFGTSGDLPVPGDFDGDGKADIAVYRPSAGSWYRVNSGSNQFVAAQFGIAEDKPLVADFDGDGKTDLAVYRPSNGYWYRVNSSTNRFVANQFGISEDKPVPADYDGDGKADLAVFRPSNSYWYRIHSSNTFVFVAVPFGLATDKPAPADYDGDGKADIGVFRPSDGYWYLLRSALGFHEEHYGINGDVAAPNAFIR